APIRVVLTGAITSGVHALNAVGSGPSGGSRQGAFWLVQVPIPAGGTVALELLFDNPNALPLVYDLEFQDNPGYSEAVAAAQAFEALDSPLQDDIVAFLRAQMTGAKFGEGSGGLAVGALCGNGVLDPGEECDDGNTVSGDCCSALCFFEQGGCACNDANVCTDDGTCNGTGTCQVVGFNANPCQGQSRHCDDGNGCTDDSCDPATGDCVMTPNTAACDDGNACTTRDTCANGGCHGGPPLACDDGNVCTTDSCDPAVGCVHAAN